MDIGSILLILAMLVLVGFIIIRPLLQSHTLPPHDVHEEGEDLSYILSERDRILDAIRELEFDHSVGKIDQSDFPILRKNLVLRGSNVLKKIDELRASDVKQDLDEQLEDLIYARRRALDGAPQGEVPRDLEHYDDSYEEMIAGRRRTREEKAVGFCPSCGGALRLSDQFCPKCGNIVD